MGSALAVPGSDGLLQRPAGRCYGARVETGSQLGSYRLGRLLGCGATGLVYQAEHTSLGRQVALKLLRPELTADADAVSRFLTEAQAVNRIRHEHIVDITDFAVSPDGQHYFVMELLDGESLAQRLEQGALDPEGAQQIALELCDALGASHQAGVIHRDLKPENVFLVERPGHPNFVKLFDFGFAKLLFPDANPVHRTKSGEIRGSASYMSPEQCQGISRRIDHRADVYALGVLLYEMVTGQLPFRGQTPIEVLLMHMSAPFPSARARVPDLPPASDRLLWRATAKDPQDRWPSMTDFAAALAALSLGG